MKDYENSDYIREREMFEKSFQRPTDFLKLSPERQWEIDKQLGILDWQGKYLTEEDMKKLKEHFKIKERNGKIKRKNK